jgi:hypothetical protein
MLHIRELKKILFSVFCETTSWTNILLSNKRCGEACPGGSHEECTGDDIYCYADIPCSSSRSVPDVFPPTGAYAPASTPTDSYLDSSSGYRYCGVDAGDATDRCWQECNSDADCCFNQYCKFKLCDNLCHDVLFIVYVSL